MSSPPLYRVTQQLIHALGHKPFTPGIKGRFYDQIQRKLDQLTTLDSNEIATLDFRDIVHRLAHRAQCEQARQRLSPGDVIMTNKP